MPLNPDGQGDPQDAVGALELPLPPDAPTEAVGIFQADVIIRSALVSALADLRANPQLLDYCFASLPRDPLTAATYGEAEVGKAKDWFQHTEIRVFLNVNSNEMTFPCVTIALQASGEVDNEGTTADVHYQPVETRDLEWPVLYGPTTPLSYDQSTGFLVLDQNQIQTILLEPGMVVVTRTGEEFVVLDATDEGVQVDTGAEPADFVGLVIKAPRPSQTVELESAVFRETYVLGCHADSEATNLTYLHSVVMFALLRYRQALLEARGFERSSVSSTDFTRDDQILPETVYSRYVTVGGTVRHVWPKGANPNVTSIIPIVSASQVKRK